MIIYRPASQTDLTQAHDVFYQKEILLINIPGPHPAPASLLNLGFHITYVETFLSTASTPFFDARSYISSGSNLF